MRSALEDAMASEKHIVVGLMSGTSVDAVDAALLETDGEDFVRPIAFAERPYRDSERHLIREATAVALAMDQPQRHPMIDEAERLLTEIHAEAVKLLPAWETAGLIGFHGQTVAHRPPSSGHANPFTWQIGDAGLLARLTGLPVVHDFRSADVAAGGEGAPLAPGYHRALVAGLELPVAVLNLGGVGNLTWFSQQDWGGFDTGPANGLIDDWVFRHRGERFDRNGAMAASGKVDEAVLSELIANGRFRDSSGPKSFDRADFAMTPIEHLSDVDGAATLTAFTAETVAIALGRQGQPFTRVLATGGGRRNPTMLKMISERAGVPADAVEAVGWNGDALEAEAFGWLAVRHMKGLPLSWPETTGVPKPLCGGRLVQP